MYAPPPHSARPRPISYIFLRLLASAGDSLRRLASDSAIFSPSFAPAKPPPAQAPICRIRLVNCASAGRGKVEKRKATATTTAAGDWVTDRARIEPPPEITMPSALGDAWVQRRRRTSESFNVGNAQIE